MTRICLGKIAAAHGIKGLVKILFYGEDAGLLNGALYTSEAGDDQIEITLKNPLGKYWLAEIRGIDGRNQAEEIAGAELYLERDNLPEIEDEFTFYHDELIGLNVLDQSGKIVGRVMDVQDYGGGDLLDIQPENGSGFLLPFAKKYISKVDTEAGNITVDIPEGLIN